MIAAKVAFNLVTGEISGSHISEEDLPQLFGVGVGQGVSLAIERV